MKVVLDASAAIRGVIANPSSESVLTIIEAASAVIAPDLYIAELANGLAKYIIARQISTNDASAFFARAYDFVSDFRGLRELSDEVLRVAATSRHPAYDCYYAVLAQRERATVFTFDERLKRLLAAMDVPSI